MRMLVVGLALIFPAVCSAQEQQWGSLEGKVTLKGPIPRVMSLDDKVKTAGVGVGGGVGGVPLKLVDETWVVDPKSKGVANVFVYLVAQKGTVFPLHLDDRIRKKPVEIEVKDFRFQPHVVAHFPFCRDADGRVYRTKEGFRVKNAGPRRDSIRGIGDPLKNPGFNINLEVGQTIEVDVKPQRLPVMVESNLHPWMNAKIMIFDHPYFAVTKADGTFSMPRVPVGEKITIMTWHEAVGWVVGPAGRPVVLKAGRNVQNFEIGALAK